MGRTVFRYRFDVGQDVVVVRAEGKSRTGGYYALGSVKVDRGNLSKSDARASLLAAVEKLAADAGLKGS